MRFICPWCGERDHREFTYRGDATATRPPLDSTDLNAHQAYIYDRGNTPGDHDELWLHTGGCRRHVRVTRNTTTHALGPHQSVGPWKAVLNGKDAT